MKLQSTIGKLGLVLVGLLAVIGLRAYLPQLRPEKNGYADFWEKLTPEMVTEINIKQGETQIDLKKTGTDWNLGEYRADAKGMGEWLKTLLSSKTPEIVAETQTSHERLGVAETGTVMTIKAGETNYVIHLGTETAGGRYIRLNDQEKVYLVAALPSTLSSTEQNDWVDKKLTDYMQAEMNQVIVEYGKTRVSLTQAEGKWYEEGKTIELETADFSTALSTIATLNTLGLAEEQAVKLKPAEMKVTLTAKGEEILLNFYPVDEETDLVSASNRKGLFKISKSMVESLKIAKESLKPKPSPTPTS